MKTIEIEIKQELENSKAILEEQGDKLKKILEEKISNSYDKIIFDFKDIELLSTPFLNHFLGNLLLEKGKDYKEILSRISFKNLNKDDIDLVYLVVANSINQQ